MRLEGRTALVTGGASGIGAATARRLSGEGARVAIADVNAEGAREVAAEIDGFAVTMDVLDTESVRAGVAAATDALGPIAILVNNAGIPDANYATKLPLELVDAVLDTNVRAPFLLSREVLRPLFRAPQVRGLA